MPVYPDFCACPGDHLLGQYVRQQLALATQHQSVTSHVGQCEACEMRVGMLTHPESLTLAMPAYTKQMLATPLLSAEDATASQAKHVAALQHEEARQRPVERLEAGQLWLTRGAVTVPGQREPVFATASPYVVLITLDDEEAYDEAFPEIRVAPLCPPTHRRFMGPFDLWVEASESPLSFPFFITCWNTQPMLRCNLDRIMGRTDDALLERVLDLLDQEFDSDYPQAHAHLPPQQLQEMLSFQGEHLDDTLYLRAPVNALVGYWEAQAAS